MADDLQERIRKFAEEAPGDSEPPSSDDRPSQITIKWEMGKTKVKWGRTVAACLLAAGSIAELLLEALNKGGGVIAKIAEIFHH